MKRRSIAFLSVLLVVAVLLATFTQSAKASFTWSPSTFTGGSWNMGTEVKVDLEATPAPYDWMQLLSKGVVTTGAGTLCHPIEPDKYGWVVNVYQWVDGSWIKLDTSYAWMPDEEGSYNACAVTYTAGTYALFGYYDSARDETASSIVESGVECDFSFVGQYRDYGDIDTDWDAQTFGLAFYVPTGLFSQGDPVTYSIYDVSPEGAITNRLTGSTKLGAAMPYFLGTRFPALFTKTISYSTTGDVLPEFTVHLYFPNQACYKDVTIEMLYCYGYGSCD
jgi:hypothetical protein